MKVYILKMVSSSERKDCLKYHLTHQHWNGVILDVYSNRLAAIKVARVSNFVQRKAKHPFYYVVEPMIINEKSLNNL